MAVDFSGFYTKLIGAINKNIRTIMLFLVPSAVIVFLGKPIEAATSIALHAGVYQAALICLIISVSGLAISIIDKGYNWNKTRLSVNRRSKDLQLLLKQLEAYHHEIINNCLTTEGVLSWASKTSPLLRFNDDIYKKFVSHIGGLETFSSSSDRQYFDNVLSKMKFQLTRAIDEIKIKLG